MFIELNNSGAKEPLFEIVDWPPVLLHCSIDILSEIVYLCEKGQFSLARKR